MTQALYAHMNNKTILKKERFCYEKKQENGMEKIKKYVKVKVNLCQPK
jgi:hypothetical protein